jgi:hypothetical protein
VHETLCAVSKCLGSEHMNITAYDYDNRRSPFNDNSFVTPYNTEIIPNSVRGKASLSRLFDNPRYCAYVPKLQTECLDR